MIEIILDTLIDALKLLPFLFVAFLIIELIEHKLTKKGTKLISDSKKLGPVLGSSVGIVPQCGFSAMATNLYVTRIITLGTLIAVYLSTSDEMLPILISEHVDIRTIIYILFIKWVTGIAFGYLIDLFIKQKEELNPHELCDHDHCDCEHESIFLSCIKHTISTMLFILISTFIINLLFEYIDLSKLFNNHLSLLVAPLIGLIPNCGASIMLTELYLKGVISISSCIGGLLTGSGVALLILFKTNKNIKENIKIMILIYSIGLIVGSILEIFI